MPQIYISTFIPGKDPQTIWQQFDNNLLEKANPPWVSAELLRYDGNQVDDQVHLRINLVLLKQDCVSVITHYQEDENGYDFIDEGKQLPFFLKSWQHHHVIRKEGNGSTIIDDINFSTGTWLTDILFYPILYTLILQANPIKRPLLI
ncbi:MAG: hypothetical protein BRD49_05805 [Bacteroidetes bacterium SW_10_40_5]|nr:MAG: hypothetical protein BRD49_05805 [Bacteroidetes bacterium SW_10_40_5]